MSQSESELSVRDAEPDAGSQLPPAEEEQDPSLPGTLFLLMLFLAGTVGLWGAIYWLLLSR